MSKIMLVDAAYPEETRLAVCENGRIEEFDYQNSKQKSIKGNIYLAKVMRVEPSLQAVFVDYGDDKHGFLSFSEIHPDYYQIPISDKEKILQEIEDARTADEERESELAKTRQADQDEQALSESDTPESDEEIEPDDEENLLSDSEQEDDDSPEKQSDQERNFRAVFQKRYKIQEVIKKDQVILAQVTKVARGNKGASLTTYITLAGRYCVLMPNATKKGGISRKIESESDRKRLQKAVSDILEESEMKNTTLIIRTAGAKKSKTHIKRDFSYLMKLWNEIRERALNSNAPDFIYEEGDVIKRSIRDVYDSSIEKILIQGERQFKEAKKFMTLIVPKSVSKLSLYTADVPIFTKHKIEEQVANLTSPSVTLRSGGYIVINKTEALFAIDVNSGRLTSERDVEKTALKTNLEAAKEVARQFKLRDISGLIVIDFIDMLSMRNRRAVEKKLKESLVDDKARIQVGRISRFGLIEISRQRLKQSFFDATTLQCEHCTGKGFFRNVHATALSILRAIKGGLVPGSMIEVGASSKPIIYILNHKKADVLDMEQKYNVTISFKVDLEAGNDNFFFDVKRGANLTDDTSGSSSNNAIQISEDIAETEDEQITPPEETEKKVRPRHRVQNTNTAPSNKKRLWNKQGNAPGQQQDALPQKRKRRFVKKADPNAAQSNIIDRGQEYNTANELNQDDDFATEHVKQTEDLRDDDTKKSLLQDIWSKISK